MLHEVREEPRLALPRFGVPAAESVSSGEPPRFVQQIILDRGFLDPIVAEGAPRKRLRGGSESALGGGSLLFSFGSQRLSSEPSRRWQRNLPG